MTVVFSSPSCLKLLVYHLPCLYEVDCIRFLHVDRVLPCPLLSLRNVDLHFPQQGCTSFHHLHGWQDKGGKQTKNVMTMVGSGRHCRLAAWKSRVGLPDGNKVPSVQSLHALPMCVWGFSPGTQVSSQSPKICTFRVDWTINFPGMYNILCMWHAMEWRPLQGVFPVFSGRDTSRGMHFSAFARLYTHTRRRLQ